MEENTEFLVLPGADKLKRRGKRRILSLLFGCGLLVSATYGAWMYFSVRTANAVLEGNPVALGAQAFSLVAEVTAKKNEQVAAGQTLIRLNARADASNAAEAATQDASARNPLPPPIGGKEDATHRIAEAQAAEQDLGNRITQARALENEAVRNVQRKAEAHAAAQLDLRRLDALSAQYTVSRAQHDQARIDEDRTRQQLADARATREEYSRARAAVEYELNRIKTELEELKTENRQATPVSPTMPSAFVFTDLVAPVDAVVAEVLAQPGMWAQPQQPLIVLMPVAKSLEATAWFPEKDGVHIRPGQTCSVFAVETPGKSFSGKVEQVLPADSLPPKFPLAAQARHIPVRIRFSANDAAAYAKLKPGMRVAVRVHAFTPPQIPWAYIDALVEKIRGK
ncbi:MAG: HlyD family efflux transporter periplasmic adaptor subunit [Deltaproteobacteria bacterium]|jgi:multidrug resistance efflux pump|nr:HlyD family efflux transporter periplasmic adaptor subunit [Deltaproteobacteria bacterium]